RKMEVTVVTGFSAKRNMNINTCHIVRNFCKLVELKMAKINEYRCCTLLMLCFLCVNAAAQKECKLIIKPVDSVPGLINDLKLPAVFPTKTKCIAYVQQLPQLLMTKGYIGASVDSVWEDSSSVQLLLFMGEKYVWDSLHIDEN